MEGPSRASRRPTGRPCRNGVTHKPAIAGYDPKMAVLEKVFLIIELLLVFGLVTKITFGA
jgi:hypothetical protein